MILQQLYRAAVENFATQVSHVQAYLELYQSLEKLQAGKHACETFNILIYQNPVIAIYVQN